MEKENLLTIQNLVIAFGQGENNFNAIAGIDLSLKKGEILALVGESGSGKTLTSLAIMQLLPDAADIRSGEIYLKDKDLLTYSQVQMRGVRGKHIAMVFQEPMTALNPVLSIGEQIIEVFKKHTQIKRRDYYKKCIELLNQVGIQLPELRIKQYPHQLSGGMKQRAMIAMALAAEPEILIADEPTSALDVTIQAEILKLLKSIQKKNQMTILFITHDFAIVKHFADRVAVMYQGKIVEKAATIDFFRKPQHPYSQALLKALPKVKEVTTKDSDKPTDALIVKNLKVYFPIKKGLLKRTKGYIKAVDDVSFKIQTGKTLALVGESGCGKTTIAKSILRLLPEACGEIKLFDKNILNLNRTELKNYRKQTQIIFQDPFSSMNPRMMVQDIIAEGIYALKTMTVSKEIDKYINQLLEQVGLPSKAKLRYPHEFSGGQRQRICIARALAVNPKVIICDEPTSALDVSVQAQILQLLRDLQKQWQVTYLFITHNLAVVANLADEVAVMYQGKIVEMGETGKILSAPQHSYSKKLLSAVAHIP